MSMLHTSVSLHPDSAVSVKYEPLPGNFGTLKVTIDDAPWAAVSVFLDRHMAAALADSLVAAATSIRASLAAGAQEPEVQP